MPDVYSIAPLRKKQIPRLNVRRGKIIVFISTVYRVKFSAVSDTNIIRERILGGRDVKDRGGSTMHWSLTLITKGPH